MIVLSVTCAINLVVTAGALYDEGVFPLIIFVVPMLVASVALQFWPFAVSVLLQVFCVATVVGTEGATMSRLIICAVLAVIAAMLLTMATRADTGLPGALGESMLIDLRDRLHAQGELPRLPDQWYAQSALRSAGGAQFAGDFLVASRPPGSDRLEVVVVDVSGKGLGAGTRALQLSGAFGGLLGALPPEEFLPAANVYLLRQDWDEGFATAVHLMIDLRTGDFEVRTAGHPPMLQWKAGSGRWYPHPSDGPALGLLEQAKFASATGSVRSGDALLLYTDGLVESPSQDFMMGIDKLIGEAERMLTGGFDNGAQRLLARLDSSNDDRALLVLHRR
ncbi:MAG: PP2C family protein-serine/threonine phosphatase [Nocardioidaceae bacterium]